MANQAGDPRSNATGEIPFDPNEYPGPPPVPPPPPPPPPNVKGWAPYRGQEQHGVRFQLTPEQANPLAGEDEAISHYTDDTQRLQDINPPPPLRVTVVESPNLTLPLEVSFGSYRLAPSTTAFTMIVPGAQLRKRVKLSVVDSGGGSVSAYVSNSPDAIPATSKFVATAGGVADLYAGETNDPLYVQIAAAAGGIGVVNYEVEYYLYQGERLL